MMRYLIGLVVVVGLIIALIILLLPGSKPKTLSPHDLVGYASTGATARLTIDGPVTNEQTHQAVRISVTNTSVTYQQLNGYNEQVSNQQTFPSSVAAYDVFLHSLAHGGFTLGNRDPKLSDERGFCPLGDRYIFEFMDENGNSLERFWATSCNGTPKTFNGNLPLNRALFQAQVPGYSDLSGQVNL